MEINFDVKIDTGVLYDYSLYHTYTSLSGIVGTAVGVLLILCFLRDHSLLYLIFGIVVIAYLPVNLYIACRQRALTVESYKKPLHYRLDDDGITVSQDDIVQNHSWDCIIKAVGTRKSIILYTGKNVATIFPRESMGEETVPVISMICSKVDPKRVKIRY